MQALLIVLLTLLKVDWHSLLLGAEEWNFLPEVVIRSIVMFLLIIFSLRILGKRSVTQLSVFELGVIIGLGSAAGDPMFYKEVGLLPGILVFVVVISMYRLMTYFINHSEKMEKVLEGEPVYLVEEGKMNYPDFKAELIAQEEFFSELRQHNVSHLGQVQLAIIETNGAISVYFYEDREVAWGLPILPHLYDAKQQQLPLAGSYACSTCGQVANIQEPIPLLLCNVCGKQEWVAATNNRRIT